jgi:hypothetical protein
MELRTFRRVAGSVSVYAAEAALQVIPVLQTGAGIGVVVGLFFAESGPSAVSTAVRSRLPFGCRSTDRVDFAVTADMLQRLYLRHEI